ncbi:MAG: autophagy-related protein 13-domain-containing protein [Benniella sp.]|nr:MAG: autophagy-related protein 13-domain-containing protein [Benniella sp.]
MSRHSSISSYYQPSSRPESPALFSSAASSTSSNPQQQQQQHQQQQQQQQHQQQQQLQPPPHHPHQQPSVQQPPAPRNSKTDQILQNFYVKIIQIVVLARVTHTDTHGGISTRKGSLRGASLVKKTSKWFNLELEDLDIYKEDVKFWRAMAITDSPPAMTVELLLDTSELSSNQILVLMDGDNRKTKVDISGSTLGPETPMGQPRTRKNIILESWSLTLSNVPPDPIPEPPIVYKKSIIFFRSLYAYMRLLPAYHLYRRLRKQNHPLKIGFRVSRGHNPEESMLRDSEIGMEVPLIEGETRSMLSEYRFGQVETHIGAFSLKVTYRSNCEFYVEESEAGMGSNFLDMEENYFTPTIVTHSQESVRSTSRPSMDGNPQRRAQPTAPLAGRPSSELYSSGTFQDQFVPVSSLRPRRNSAQSLQQKSGENSSSQSSVSSLGTRMSRRGSSGAPGALLASIDQQTSSGTPPFSMAHGGHGALAKHYVDPIMESPPFKLGSSQADSRRQLPSSFSPFKSPSLSSSPSPSYLDALPSSLASRPSSTHLNRSPSSSSMHRVHSSQQGSGLLGPVTTKPTNIIGVPSSIPTPGANLLSTSAKSNASSTSAPRVTSSFGHRHDTSSRRASSESLPPGRAQRNSGLGSSSNLQLTSDDDDLGSFVRMLETFQEPLKIFGKAGGSGIGPSFAQGDSSLTASGLKAKSSLDRFQQLKQSHISLSESMSASHIVTKEPGHSPLSITTGHPQRRSNLSDVGPSSPLGSSYTTSVHSNVNRNSQSFSHQPPTPSPLHSEIPVDPPAAKSGLSGSLSRHTPSKQSIDKGKGTSSKRSSWIPGGNSSSGGSFSGGYQDILRKGSSIGSMAFRHGSLDQGKDTLWQEEVMGKMGIGTSDDLAFGSFPEDVHHHNSLYSAPLDTGRDTRAILSGSHGLELPFAQDPRPIHVESSSSRPARPLRLSSGSGSTGFTLPRLRPRAADDNDSLNEVSTDSHSGRGRRDRANEDEDEEDEEEEDGYPREIRPSHDSKQPANTSIDDDDGLLFIMSELSPGSTSTPDYPLTGVLSGTRVASGGVLDRNVLNLRSQSRSPSFGNGGNGGGNGSNGGSSSSSPHFRLLGRSNNNTSAGHDNNNGSNSRSNSAAHSRVGSSNGSSSIHQNSIENLNLLRRPGSGSGFLDDNINFVSTPPLFPASATGAGAFDAMLEGRRMSRGGSDRGLSSGVNSSHSESRGSRLDGW